jgi:hypothetical protein
MSGVAGADLGAKGHCARVCSDDRGYASLAAARVTTAKRQLPLGAWDKLLIQPDVPSQHGCRDRRLSEVGHLVCRNGERPE